ncbi:MAG: 2,3-bisphosphoglycerate-independent phosphoglycerate mutase, partial [Candidatus Shapirobacteria bacterium]|nr:2,3-bisphosphoglycerate-independent phosphoglycerate mutase [Candidatus Shapirobacteria bacterium]
NEKIKEIGVGEIATVSGRYYSMDRDTNWERTALAADLWIDGEGFEANDAVEAINKAYERGEATDYYVQPTLINKNGLLKDKDSFIWFNFRTDRSRQITAMMTRQPLCPVEFQTDLDLTYVCMGRYDESWDLPVAFLPENVVNNLSEVLSKNNKSQVKIAETEKYAHVTFFFNSQLETEYKGEDRIMVPSPKVPSYDLQPEMSAPEVCQKVLENIGNYDFILVNFANADLVGHSGKFEAVKKACEVVDQEVEKIVDKGLENDYVIIVGADHGNAEHMLYDNGEVDVSHGFDPVKFSFVGLEAQVKDGGLKDVAPTILEILGIEKPVEMTGESLIING